MHTEGVTKDARMKNALKVILALGNHLMTLKYSTTYIPNFPQAIAPAVLNGGFSTLLAVILLATSDVYVFVAFFKIFVSVVFFGLYNGLVFLPVLLTLIGPTAAAATTQQGSQPKKSQSASETELEKLNTA